jgi:hypothetical protein
MIASVKQKNGLGQAMTARPWRAWLRHVKKSEIPSGRTIQATPGPVRHKARVGKVGGGSTHRIRAVSPLALLVACALISGLVFAAAPAFASNQYVHTGGIHVPEPGSVAVNQTTDHIYVISHESVENFDSAGELDPSTPTLTGGELFAPAGIAVDNSNTATAGDIYVSDAEANAVYRYAPTGNYLETVITEANIPHNRQYYNSFHPGSLAVDAHGDIYLDNGSNIVEKFSPAGKLLSTSLEGATAKQGNLGVIYGVATNSLGSILVSDDLGIQDFNGSFECVSCAPISTASTPALAIDSADVVYGDQGNQVSAFERSGNLIERFGNGVLSGSSGIGVNSSTGRIYVANPPAESVEIFEHVVSRATAEPAREITDTTATLVGQLETGGYGEVTRCRFEYGVSLVYGANVPCSPAPPYQGSPEISTKLTGLSPGVTYHYRIAATNANGVGHSNDGTFTTVPTPLIAGENAVNATESSADLTATIDPNGLQTNYHFEYGLSAAYGSSAVGSEPEIAASTANQDVTAHLSALTPSTTYHFRVVAENADGISVGSDHTFVTCLNGLARQQTGAASLLDCRAYELVSAAFAGGYNVESNLVAGQRPYEEFPEAEDPPKVLYALHDGAIPGVSGDPTNRGPDPYVATRTTDGWRTQYVGIPEDGTPSMGPFSSTPTAVDSDLATFAFGGSEGCSPCFSQGSTETGVPIRLSNGELVQGMSGDISEPGAKPEGFIGQSLSSDGDHFVFGSRLQFEPAGNSNGDISIYDRDLKTAETHVVSNTPGGATMKGTGIGEVAMSRDGSHILIGQLISEVEGAKYWHLYMDIDDATNSIDITPGASQGVLFDGMTADGSKVFFSSSEHLTGEDTGHSGADIFEWQQGKPLALISKGEKEEAGQPGDTASCDPAGNSKRSHWNTPGSEVNCSAVAIAGGGGVASSEGSIYFLSPELLDGPEDGVENAPNLYLARPGAAPEFVATLESGLTGPHPPLTEHPVLGHFGSFTEGNLVASDNSGGSSSGAIYVADTSSNMVSKFAASGELEMGWGEDGQLKGSSGEQFGDIAGVAVGPTGTLYVLNTNSMLFEFSPSGSSSATYSLVRGTERHGVAVDSAGDFYKVNGDGSIEKFSQTGADLGQVTSGISATGLSVDPATNELYVDGGNVIDRYSFNGAGEVEESGGGTCPVAPFSGCGATESFGIGDIFEGTGLAVDPATHDLYVDEGSQVVELDQSGNQIGSPIGSGTLNGSYGLTLNSAGDLYASNSGSSDVVDFGPTQLAADPLTDNSVVVNAVGLNAERRHTGDFQVTPEGEFAVFTSALPLTGFENAGHREIFRYDTSTQRLDCVSCGPASSIPTSDAALASAGLSLTDDGRVFFETSNPLSSRDLDEKEDVYEWEEGAIELISAGTSPTASRLLGADASGTDVYFFTTDVLAPQDQNGAVVKVYDARTEGGFFEVPKTPPCKASDECHGPGSPAPSPVTIGSTAIAGTGNVTDQKRRCSASHIERRGVCVKRPHNASHRRRTKHVRDRIRKVTGPSDRQVSR